MMNVGFPRSLNPPPRLAPTVRPPPLVAPSAVRTRTRIDLCIACATHGCINPASRRCRSPTSDDGVLEIFVNMVVELLPANPGLM